MAVKRTPAGLRTTLFTLTNPGTRQRNDDGGYDVPRVPLSPPTAWGSLTLASPKDLERLAAGTTLAKDSFIVVIPFHPQVTTKTSVTWTDRRGISHAANVTDVSNPDQSCIETVMVIVEIVP